MQDALNDKRAVVEYFQSSMEEFKQMVDRIEEPMLGYLIGMCALESTDILKRTPEPVELDGAEDQATNTRAVCDHTLT